MHFFVFFLMQSKVLWQLMGTKHKSYQASQHVWHVLTNSSTTSKTPSLLPVDIVQQVLNQFKTSQGVASFNSLKIWWNLIHFESLSMFSSSPTPTSSKSGPGWLKPGPSTWETIRNHPHNLTTFVTHLRLLLASNQVSLVQASGSKKMEAMDCNGLTDLQGCSKHKTIALRRSKTTSWLLTQPKPHQQDQSTFDLLSEPRQCCLQIYMETRWYRQNSMKPMYSMMLNCWTARTRSEIRREKRKMRSKSERCEAGSIFWNE